MFTLPQLRVTTTPLPNRPELARLLSAPRGQLAWFGPKTRFVAAGVAAKYDEAADASAAAESQRFARAAQWWSNLQADAEIRDQVKVPGSGLISLGSFSFFSDSPAGSTLIIPQVIVGISEDSAFLTIIGPTDVDPFDVMDVQAHALLTATLHQEYPSYTSMGEATAQSLHSADEYAQAVSATIARIQSGEVDKVVFAREKRVTTTEPIDERTIISDLLEQYPDCWVYAVDGLVGATPELLVSVNDGVAHSRVLAGTISHAAEFVDDALLESAKDLREHRVAVNSVVDVLSRLGTTTADAEPHLLSLSNVAHLASEVHTELGFAANALQISGALHPTAALGGAPRDKALEIIRELEGIDRDRYGAPVGWLGASDNGEWCVALRCVRVDGETAARAWAGGGIMADSEISAEFAETEAKFAPIMHAFGIA